MTRKMIGLALLVLVFSASAVALGKHTFIGDRHGLGQVGDPERNRMAANDDMQAHQSRVCTASTLCPSC